MAAPSARPGELENALRALGLVVRGGKLHREFRFADF